MQGGPGTTPPGDGGDVSSSSSRPGRVRPQHLQFEQRHGNNNSNLMGIAHRHDEALSHNPTPSETLVGLHDGGGETDTGGKATSSDVGTGTLGAAPSPLQNKPSRPPGSNLDGALSATTVLPARLFGEASGSALPIPGGRRKGGGEAGSNPSRIFQQGPPPPHPPPPSASTQTEDGGGDAADVASDTSSTCQLQIDEDESGHLDDDHRRRSQDNVDGGASSDLVRMLMRSSPTRGARRRRRADTDDSFDFHDEDELLEDDDDGMRAGSERDGVQVDGDESDSDSSSSGPSDEVKLALGGSKWDYDMNWDMVGHGRTMIMGEPSAGVSGGGGGGGERPDLEAPSSSTTTSSVAAAAVAASAAVAAAVRSDDASVAKDPATATAAGRPVTPTTTSSGCSASHAFDSSDDAATARTSRSAEDAAAQRQRLQLPPAPAQQQQSQLLAAPSSPVHALPARRRTRSAGQAPSMLHFAASQQQQRPSVATAAARGGGATSGSRRRRQQQLPSYRSSPAVVDPLEEFDDVRNLDSLGSAAGRGRQRQRTATSSDSAIGEIGDVFDDFDDFAGTPALGRTVSLDGGVVRGGDVGLSTTESLASGSSSSSSSLSHRRRRGLSQGSSSLSATVAIAAAGQPASSPSVSSFSGSMSSASVQHGTGRGAAAAAARGVRADGRISGGSAGSAGSAAMSSGGGSRAASSLRTSLDAGMAAVRRWARSHAGVAGTAAASAAQAGGRGPPRPSRAATLQLGEEDLFALTNAGVDPRRSSASALGEEEEAILRHDVFGMGRLGVFPPPPIAEEDEASPTMTAGRHRAFSEPDRARVRNFFRRRAASSSSSSQNRTAAATSSQEMSPQGGSSIGRFGRRRRTGQQPEDDRTALAVDDPRAGGSIVPPQSSSSEVASSTRSLSSAAVSSSLFHSHSLPPQDRGAVDEMDLLESGRVTRSSSGTGVIPLSRLGLDGGAATGSEVDDEGTSRDGEGGDAPAPAGEGENSAGTGAESTDADPNRQARSRWIRINRRFQLIITIVALIFSLLLFAILVCWVVLTSAYVVSIDKPCDVPLKKYFWLATLQLILDVFRSDIMRFVFRWDSNSRQRIPMRVVVYNVAYLTYAMLVLRLGVKSVFMSDEATCPNTAPELFQTSAAFVSLSLAAWSTIVVGYLGPFCFVAIILTRNGYSPSADFNGRNDMANTGVIPGVFPTYSNNGAPPECIDRLRVVLLDEFPDEYPKDCCICMADFVAGEVIVVTECEHVFHKRCCQEWLQQARTCPVCRTDIPSALGISEEGSDGDDSLDGTRRREGERPNRPPLNREEFHQEVVSLLRILRQHEERLRDRLTQQEREGDDEAGSIGPQSVNAASQAEDIMSNEERMPGLRPGSD